MEKNSRISKDARICTVYRGGVGAILTSLCCSLCTCLVSQLSLSALGDATRSPEMQAALSVSIFVVGYWVVYFALRRRVQRYLIATGLVLVHQLNSPSKGGKLFFVCASEVFWIVALGGANFYLLRVGYSAELAAMIAQWGINLTLWLPLLPLWEWFATDYLPSKVCMFIGFKPYFLRPAKRAS
jgi:hypothetical protein